MACSCRVFALLIYKNLLVRKRHWKLTIFLETLVPIAFFLLTQAVRDFSTDPPIQQNASYYPVYTEEDLLTYDVPGDMHLYYVPNDEYTRGIVEESRHCMKHVLHENTKGFDSEKDMIDSYIYQQSLDSRVVVLGVVFEKYGTNTTEYKYKIRHSNRILNALFQDDYMVQSGRGEMFYYEENPFLQLQLCIDRSLINRTVPHSMSNIERSIQRMPYPSHIEVNVGDIVLREVIGIFAVVAFLIPLCIEIGYVAKEKAIGVTVLMEMNGVKLYQSLLSWLFTGILFSNLFIIPIIILFKNTMSGNVDPYLRYGNAFIFWLILIAHIAHLLSFGLHLSAYFSKPAFVIIILTIVYTAASSLHGNMVRQQAFAGIPYLGILFPNMLLLRLLEETSAYEMKLVGIQWNNLFVIGDTDYSIVGSAGFVLIFSILGAVLHFLLAVCVNAVLPGKYGIRKHPLYFLKCTKKNKISFDEEIGDFDYNKVNSDDFEAVSPGLLTPGIQIRDLKKTYRTSFIHKSTVQALRGISVDFYKGQITALLGHNGAGKTTLMSILTGVTDETAGKVFINGRNVKKDLESLRNDLGLCPQENMVFPDLSVFEQIEFFGMLKGQGKNRKQIKHEVNILLSKLKLSMKRDTIPSKLSGGQKRRLCLGMALIGNADILILDEPTSGMDPETRRDTWDMILKMRGEKTILISTHNMEEADILGDRIAIVHAGRLKCYGTSMFLKKQYGHGQIEVTLSTKPWCNSEKVVNKFDAGTRAVIVDNEKIILSVPYSDSLPDSLDKIESQKKKLGVTGVSVSLITLEQVFLKVVKKEDDGKHLNDLFMAPLEKVDGCKLCLQMIAALYEKKATYTRKNLGHLLLIIVLPLISVLLMALSYNIPSEPTDVFPLSLDMYRYPQAFCSADNESIGQVYKTVVEGSGGTPTLIPSNISLTQAILNFAEENLAEYRNNLIASAEFNDTEDGVLANAFYSGTAMHSLPLTVNLLSNSILKYFAGDKFSIEISRQRLPSTLTSREKIPPEMESIPRTILFCTFFFPTLALFVLHPLQEMSTKVKQLQRMTGVTPVSYWSTILTFDLVIFLLSVVFVVLGFYIMDIILDIRLYHCKEIMITLLLLFLFGINALLLVYIFSFIDKSKSTVMTILSLVPIGTVIVQFLLHLVIYNFEHLRSLHSFQKRLFRLVPYVSFFHGQYAFFNIAVENARCRRMPEQLLTFGCDGLFKDVCCYLDCSNGTCKNPLPYFNGFEKDFNLEEALIYLAVSPLIYFTILIMLEAKVFLRLTNKVLKGKLKNGCDTMDEQVKKEKHAVAVEISKMANKKNSKSDKQIKVHNQSEALDSPENDTANLFLVYELSKYYGKLLAVQEVNFRVKQRECFGLLGVNGAGKSTTFRMLTGEELPNSGLMYLGQAEIRSARKKYLSQMGYCPQTDALLDSLNAFDHLRLFARLRGIPKSKVDLEVNKWINRLNLNACMSQASGTYSGGNKRRLNIAMALIGNPALVLLDEPTTGVDPAARRSLWSILQSCQAAGQAIILTSHSMEECEALCNRLVIMVKGQLVCVGASQELKQRFGAGYDINIKLYPGRSEDDVRNIKANIEAALTCEIRDENLGFMAYHVIDANTTWKKMYSTMHELKRRYPCIEDFSVLSATLEQLFIQFARGTDMSKHVEPVEVTSQTVAA